MVWWYIAIIVVAYVVAINNIPKAESQPPAGLNDIGIPTANEGGEIPVLFGTRYISTPNVVWSGNLSTIAVKSSGGKK